MTKRLRLSVCTGERDWRFCLDKYTDGYLSPSCAGVGTRIGLNFIAIIKKKKKRERDIKYNSEVKPFA